MRITSNHGHDGCALRWPTCMRVVRGELRRGQRRHAGFTLVELVVSLGIIAVIAVLAMPSFEAFRVRERVKGAANNLYADMQFARSEAVQRNRRVTFAFVAGTSWCYGIHQGDTQCDCASPNSCNIKTVSSTDYPGVRVTSASFGSGSSWYAIDPRRGQIVDSTGAAADGSVVFVGTGGASLRADLNSVGRVRLCTASDQIGGYPACS